MGVKQTEDLAIKRTRFRIILPTAYVAVSGFLLLVCLLNLFHSIWCSYFLKSMFPSRWLGGVLITLLVHLGLVQVGSGLWGPLQESLIPVAFILTIVQYYFVGRSIDWFLRRRAGESAPIKINERQD